MIIVAHRKAGELPADTTVMVLQQGAFKTTKEAIRYVRKNPNQYATDAYLEVINPGQKFKLKENIQIAILWKGDRD